MFKAPACRERRFRGLSLSGFHEIAYTDWGPEDSPSTVICVHGLTRQGRDFDPLARALAAAGHRVLCPDLAGRGASQWLRNTLDYVFPQYCADMSALISGLEGRISWVGTSLGGLIGIVLAGSEDSPIARLALNDIGPDVPFAAAGRISLRCARMPSTFRTFDAAEASYRAAFHTCGPMNDAQWRDFVGNSLKFDEGQGCFVSRMDPKVVTAFNWLWYYQIPVWTYFRNIKAQVMSIRGENSDFAPRGMISEMRRAQPDLATFEVPGVGHMPMLMTDAEISALEAFLKF
jgi:pimeloyl-ACP methyl ester carboxylesterase